MIVCCSSVCVCLGVGVKAQLYLHNLVYTHMTLALFNHLLHLLVTILLVVLSLNILFYFQVICNGTIGEQQ